jgi:Flp pilus assembly protein TadD
LLDFDKAIAFNSKFALAWSNKSAVLERLGKLDEALIASLKAIELDPKLPLAWANNSLILRAHNREEEANAALGKARELGDGIKTHNYSMILNPEY